MPAPTRAAFFGFALVPFATGLASCTVKHYPPGVLRIGMVTDVGGLGDHSFNDSAYAGLQRAQRELGVVTAVLESSSAADY
jgi:basic membrane lipoprotein Med (substrate-binding protein (PBP1-ABC) superfamily)